MNLNINMLFSVVNVPSSGCQLWSFQSIESHSYHSTLILMHNHLVLTHSLYLSSHLFSLLIAHLISGESVDLVCYPTKPIERQTLSVNGLPLPT